MCHDQYTEVTFQQWLTSELRLDGSQRHNAAFILDFDAMPPGQKWDCSLAQFSMQGAGEAVTDSNGDDSQESPIGIVILEGLNCPYNVQVGGENSSMPSGILSRMDFSTADQGVTSCSVNPSSLAPAICCTRPHSGLYRIKLVSPVSGTFLKTEDGDMNPWMACLQFKLLK